MKGKKYTTETYNNKLKLLDIKFVCVSEYINNKTYISHICLNCDGNILLRPDHLLKYKTKCRICGSKNGFKLTNEDYDSKIKSNSNGLKRIGSYINNKTPILHECLKCKKQFKVTPKSVINGAKCKCQRKKIYKNRLSHEDYLGRLKKSNNINIDPIENYRGCNTKINHKCLKCDHIWKIKPSHLLDGTSCPQCRKISQNDYINRLPSNLIILEDFISTSNRIKHKCLNCLNIWKPKPAYILYNNTNCPICSSSKGERKIHDYLSNNGIKFIKEKIFEELNPLRFDFYCPNLNLIIEYDGIQHFKSRDFFGGDKYLIDIKNKDKIKNNFCKENSINLLRIPYYDYGHVEEIINNYISFM